MPLSKEKTEQIRKGADKFAFQVPYNGTNDFYDNDRFDAYIAGATAEAEKALCLIEALEWYQESDQDRAAAALQSYTNSLK